ncbi:hypothetical protein J6590_083201 [Homalodisca vitripennis]|nr:hypothetical protein J6590_083201 [Homalodisca vitripennis]
MDTSLRAVFRIRRLHPRLHSTLCSLQVFCCVRVTVWPPHPVVVGGTSLTQTNVFRLRRLKPRLHPTLRSLQVLYRVRVTMWLPHSVLVEGTSPANTNVFRLRRLKPRIHPTFRSLQRFSYTQLSYIKKSACCLPTPETQTSAPLYNPQPPGTQQCKRYSVATTSSSAFLYKQVCVLSSDSKDLNLGSNLHSAVSRYSAVSALQCGYHIQFWLKQPLQPTLTVEDADSTYKISLSPAFIYKQVCVLSSDSGDSNLGSTLHSAVSRYSAVSAIQCCHHIQFWLKEPLQPTLTAEEAASTYSRFHYPHLSYINKSACCLLTPETQNSAPPFTPQSPALLYKQVCVLSSDSRDSNLGCTLHSAVSRYSVVSAIHCCHHIQFWLKEPLLPTLTAEEAASTDPLIEISLSPAFLYKQVCVLSSDSGDSNLGSTFTPQSPALLYKQVCVLSSDSRDSNLGCTLHSAVSRYSVVSAIHCCHHIQFWLKEPLLPTLTAEEAASTVLSSDSGDSKLGSTLHSAVSRYSAASALQCGYHIQL